MSQVLVPRLSFKNDRISEDITCKIFNAKTGNKSNAGTPINEFSPFLNLILINFCIKNVCYAVISIIRGKNDLP